MTMNLQAKPIPAVTWQNLIPPNPSHRFFQHWRQFPFEWNAATFSLVNAWWLSEAALLAYADPPFAKQQFAQAGFKQVHFFSGRTTQCYLAVADHYIILSFRGTESNLRNGAKGLDQLIVDWRTDFDLRLVTGPDGIKVHRGFQLALDEVWKDLLLHLQTLDHRALWMTGHSLGAALATLAAARHAATQGLYTFGSPRVGDTSFRDHFDIPAFRFVHHRDVVARVPPSPYVHVGRACYLDRRGKLVDVLNNPQEPKRQGGLFEGLNDLAETVRGWSVSSAAVLPEGIRDHMPLLYALHVWNNLVGLYSIIA